MFARVTDVRRATERLCGIISGIAIDTRVNIEELSALHEWLEAHPWLTDKQPFSDVAVIVGGIVADGRIDNEEHELLVEIGRFFNDGSLASDISTRIIGALHGVLQGISSDGVIHDAEVNGLRRWLKAHSHVKGYWPVCDAWAVVDRILADGVVDDSEKQELLAFCGDFCERPVADPILKDEIYQQQFMQTEAPVLEPITSICDRAHRINFGGRTFCFTGPARYGKRSALNKIVEELGGIPSDNINRSLDYLVIGAQSNPTWAFSSYGRKIESALNLKRKNNAPLVILFEDDFIEQANCH